MADIIYTGKGIASNIPQDSGNAMARLSNFIIKAEELKYETFKQNEQEFLKTSNIDPAFFISTKNQETQTKWLNNFSNKWATRMRQSGNNLSIDDKMEMQSERNVLIAMQQEMQAKQDLWQQHRGMIMQNPNKFDLEEWSVFDENYRRTGDYSLVTPPIKARSIDMAIEDNAINSGEEILGKPIPEERGGIKGFIEQSYWGTEDMARQRVKDIALSDEAYTKDLARQFNELDPQTKLKYLDADENGIISKEEAKDFNPIIRWAQDTKWEKARKGQKGTWKAIPRSTAGTSTFNWNNNIDSFHNKNDEYPILKSIKQPTEFGTRTFPDLINLGSINQVATEAQPIDEIIDYTTGSPRRVREITYGGDKKTSIADSVRFNIIGYSPSDDVIIVKIADNGSFFYQGQVVALPADKYDDLLKRKPIGISREAFRKQQGEISKPAPPSSGVNWVSRSNYVEK